MRDATELATEIITGDWAEKKTWIKRITTAILQARAEGAAEEREECIGDVGAEAMCFCCSTRILERIRARAQKEKP